MENKARVNPANQAGLLIVCSRTAERSQTSFLFQDFLLAFTAPTIAGDCPIATDDSMAWNRKRKNVCRARSCNRPGRIGHVELLSNLPIGASGSIRYCAYRL